MDSRIKRFLFNVDFTSEEKIELQREMAKSTHIPALITAALIVVFETLMLLFALRNPIPRLAALAPLYLFLLVVTIAFGTCSAVFGQRIINEKPEWYFLMHWLYGLIICLWGSYITVATQGKTSDISVFIYVSLCVALLMPFKLWQSVSLYLVNLVGYYIFLDVWGDAGSRFLGSRINSAIVTVLCIAISATLYYNRAQNFYNRMTILKKNKEIESMNEKLRTMVLVDELTKARNRRFLEEVLPERFLQAQASQTPVSMMMIDIDHFKQYNDIYGHPQGDVCLQQIVRGIKAHLSEENNEFFVRYGGEEFIVYYSGADKKQTLILAEKLRTAVAHEKIEHVGSALGHITVSIGVHWEVPQPGSMLHELVMRADAALYAAKDAGRNRVMDSSGMTT